MKSMKEYDHKTLLQGGLRDGNSSFATDEQKSDFESELETLERDHEEMIQLKLNLKGSMSPLKSTL